MKDEDMKNNRAYQSGFEDALAGHNYKQFASAYRKADEHFYRSGYVAGLAELKKRQANSAGEKQ
ncbi:MAG: hypothetical protein ACI4SV_02100 [Duodenibacillus sp.]